MTRGRPWYIRARLDTFLAGESLGQRRATTQRGKHVRIACAPPPPGAAALLRQRTSRRRWSIRRVLATDRWSRPGCPISGQSDRRRGDVKARFHCLWSRRHARPTILETERSVTRAAPRARPAANPRDSRRPPCAQRDAETGHPSPIGIQRAHRGMREDQPNVVPLRFWDCAEVHHESRSHRIPRQDVETAVLDHGRDVDEVVEESLPAPLDCTRTAGTLERHCLTFHIDREREVGFLMNALDSTSRPAPAERDSIGLPLCENSRRSPCPELDPTR
jgi:hypothetical protein